MGLIKEHADFRRLWVGSTLSQFGSQVSMLAVPLTAVSALHASTFQVGLLNAAQGVAYLLVGLPMGAWLDRIPRRPALVAADLGRAVLLASVPVTAWLHALGLAQLYAVVFAAGLCSVCFDVGYQSYLPGLVGREQLVAANGTLEASRSAAYLVGPSIGGYLVQALTAPVAIVADAASFLWSAGWLAAIRTREPRPERVPRHLAGEIAEGLRLVLHHPVLRAFAVANAISVLSLSMEHALDVVFLARTVGLAAGGIGLLYALTGVGALLGALAAPPVNRRLGAPRAILASSALGSLALLLVPLTAPGARLACYAVGAGVSSMCIVAGNIAAVAYRQTLCPDRLLSRMTATQRFLSWGFIPAGALLGGALGTALGIRPTLWLSAAGFLAGTCWLLASPLRAAAHEDPRSEHLERVG